MAGKKGKSTATKPRASISRERQLALALRGLLDELELISIGADGDRPELLVNAEVAAGKTLSILGYESLIGIPAQLRTLNDQLKVAVEASDGATIARIGSEMVRVRAGKGVKVVGKVKTATETGQV